jgi:hypothetical protein
LGKSGNMTCSPTLPESTIGLLEARSQIRASGIATMVAESPMVTLALKASIVLLPHDRSNGYRLER